MVEGEVEGEHPFTVLEYAMIKRNMPPVLRLPARAARTNATGPRLARERAAGTCGV
ncbi:hypothetical protein ACGFW5_19905 [Streptomyces sp. NPDC048416]|uniref:hypothetical protein n=1 Tax=Streptomyces sp. NPDC048416 TaxID=3365546 RepID=UPI003723EDA8